MLLIISQHAHLWHTALVWPRLSCPALIVPFSSLNVARSLDSNCCPHAQSDLINKLSVSSWCDMEEVSAPGFFFFCSNFLGTISGNEIWLLRWFHISLFHSLFSHLWFWSKWFCVASWGLFGRYHIPTLWTTPTHSMVPASDTWVLSALLRCRWAKSSTTRSFLFGFLRAWL